MAWGQVRQQAYERQKGFCTICGSPLPRRFVLHHVINKSCGGKEVLDNAEARCPECERTMHEQYSHGNYNDPPQNHVSKKHRQHPKKSLRSYKPRLKTLKHRNHIQPRWYYYEDIAFYYREKGSHGGIRPRLPVGSAAPDEGRTLLPRVGREVQDVPVPKAKRRCDSRFRRCRKLRSGRH